MDRLSAVISFTQEQRKTLTGLLLIIGLINATITGLILLQRQTAYQSKASSKPGPKTLPVVEPGIPSGWYKLSYDQKQWTRLTKPDETFGSRIVFNLKEEYGYARVDLVEGKSNKGIDSLKDEIINSQSAKPINQEASVFKEKPSYLLTYREKILGQDVLYYRQIVKNNDNFLIIDRRYPQLGNHLSYLNNLLDGISFDTALTPKVKGVSSAETKLATVELVDLIRPSIVSIIHTYCIEILNQNPQISKLPKDKYSFCNLSKGSGFIVNEKGIVATNGHVAKIYPEEGLANNLLSKANQVFLADLAPEIGQSEDFHPNHPQYFDHVLTTVFKLVDKKAISIRTGDEKFYVNVGSDPIRINYQQLENGQINSTVTASATTYSASLLDFNYPNKYSYDAVMNKKYQSGSDVALLQIKKSPDNLFPVLELANTETLREGADIIIAGYPVLVEGGEGSEAPVAFRTSAKPTITRGIVSAVKQDPSGRKVFQTDASIDHGNSGGPAFNSSAEVVGVATFFFESKSGNFNFLRDISDIKELMSRNNVDNKAGKLTAIWRQGLDKYRNGYYKEAIGYFKQTENLFPNHPTTKEFIRFSQDTIKNGSSLEGLTGFIKSSKSQNTILMISGSISLVSFMLAGFLTILSLFPFFQKKDS